MLLAALAAFFVPVIGNTNPCLALESSVIRWIVPNRPGGGYDRYSRLIQPFLAKRLNARIVIENRTEAGGLVAAMAIRDAEVNGRTIGIINASGLLAAGAMPESRAPDPLNDFSILARVAGNQMVVFTGRDSGLADIADLMNLSAQRPVVVGVRDSGSASFFALPVTASILGLNYEIVTGYLGSTSRVLAAIRGEVDIIFQNFDSVSSYVASGELVPLLQISSPGTFGHTQVSGPPTPFLGGPDGLAARPAIIHGMSADNAISSAEALVAIIAAGRLIVAPPGMPAGLTRCLQDHLMAVLQSKELLDASKKAKLTINAVSASIALSTLQTARKSLIEFYPLVRSAIEQTRQ
jgi:tripartite-type tricarboxylate transporter receptor subunit TctC